MQRQQRRRTSSSRLGPEPRLARTCATPRAHDRPRSPCLGPAQRRAFGIRPRSRARSSRAARRDDRPPAWASSRACRQWIVHAFATGVRATGNVRDPGLDRRRSCSRARARRRTRCRRSGATPRSPRPPRPGARLKVGGRPPRRARRDPHAELPRRSRARDAPLVRMARPQVKTHGMRDARATSPVSSGPEPHDPPAILVEWSGPGTVPVSDLRSAARSGSGPVAGHGARAPHGAVIVRRRGRRAERVDNGSCTPSQRASARAERT